jgi:hypothetical protein
MYVFGEMPNGFGYDNALEAAQVNAHFAFALGKVFFH